MDLVHCGAQQAGTSRELALSSLLCLAIPVQSQACIMLLNVIYVLVLALCIAVDQYACFRLACVQRLRSVALRVNTHPRNPDDPMLNFTMLDKALFHRFSQSVSRVLDISQPISYYELVDSINKHSSAVTAKQMNEDSFRIIVDLFPAGLLPLYRATFGNLESFSIFASAWVGWLATQWLMGPSTVTDRTDPGGKILTKGSVLQVEKCRFLEAAGCVHICLHACKVPTERFFAEEMGLRVALKPNFTDYSCRFVFGEKPLPLAEDPSVRVPCIAGCPRRSTLKET
jgi:hypothetical protein